MTLRESPWGPSPSFIWDENNENEVSEHGITCFEVEECFENPYKVAPHNKRRSEPEKYGDRYRVLGHTHGGRELFIIVQHLGDVFVRPVTAFDA